MPQIHVSLVDNPSSRKLADVEVHLPAATIEFHPPDVERRDDLPIHLTVSAVAIKGIAIWSTPDRLVVTFPEEMSTLNAPTVYGPSGQPIRRVLATLVDDILTAYRDASQTAPLTPRTPRARHAHPADSPTTTENQSTSPRVGDRVRVGREFRGNPANTVAVCFDVWDRGDGTTAISLVFPNGVYDVFWWGDEFFAFERLDHIPALASYRYSTLGRLEEDIRAGVFATAWLTPLP